MYLIFTGVDSILKHVHTHHSADHYRTLNDGVSMCRSCVRGAGQRIRDFHRVLELLTGTLWQAILNAETYCNTLMYVGA